MPSTLIADPLPPLDPTDDKLLTIYLTEVNTHLPAFANKSGLPFTNAIAFLARPDIAQYISYFHKLRESTQRMIALNYLRELVEVSEDPIEQRRAATTLLRALGRPPLPAGGGGGWAPSAPPTPKQPTPPRAPTPHPHSPPSHSPPADFAQPATTASQGAAHPSIPGLKGPAPPTSSTTSRHHRPHSRPGLPQYGSAGCTSRCGRSGTAHQS